MIQRCALRQSGDTVLRGNVVRQSRNTLQPRARREIDRTATVLLHRP